MYDIVNPLAQKSILCVKSSMITRKNEVQKKIKLEDIIHSCKYFPAGSVGEGYVPLTLGITIRDKTTNRVLVKRVEKDNIKRTFIYLNDITPVPHVGYDLIMFLMDNLSGILFSRILEEILNGELSFSDFSLFK